MCTNYIKKNSLPQFITPGLSAVFNIIPWVFHILGKGYFSNKIVASKFFKKLILIIQIDLKVVNFKMFSKKRLSKTNKCFIFRSKSISFMKLSSFRINLFSKIHENFQGNIRFEISNFLTQMQTELFKTIFKGSRLEISFLSQWNSEFHSDSIS